MKFIIDAQLPPSLVKLFVDKGLDCIHTCNLPMRNLSSDSEILRISSYERRIVITKDSDFFHAFILHRKPYKVVFVTVGNMRLQELISHFELFLDLMIDHLDNHSLLEFSRTGIKVLY